MRSLRSDRRGFIQVWFVAIVSILVFGLAYWTLGMPTMDLVSWALGMSDLAPQARSTINLAVNIFAWAGLIFLFGIIAWAFVSSRSKEYIDVGL